MTTDSELKAARNTAKYWARRYQAAQAIIAELQYDLGRTIEERDRALSTNDERDALAARIRDLESAIDGVIPPGVGLLGPYTPTPDPIQGVEDGWWIGCESWETWDGDE